MRPCISDGGNAGRAPLLKASWSMSVSSCPSSGRNPGALPRGRLLAAASSSASETLPSPRSPSPAAAATGKRRLSSA